MDNKELPQEIVDKISDIGFIKEAVRNICVRGVIIAQSHYEPLLQSKDATIKQQAEQIEKLTDDLKIADETTIEVVKKLQTEKELSERLKGLLKERFLDYLYGNTTTPSEDYEKRWKSYCKEHNITP